MEIEQFNNTVFFCFCEGFSIQIIGIVAVIVIVYIVITICFIVSLRRSVSRSKLVINYLIYL